VKSRMLLLVSLVIICILTMSMPVMAADWPNFRNEPSNSGNTSETINLPLTEQWHSAAPSVEENGVVVADGIAYMCTDDSQLYAFDVATGSLISGYPVAAPFSYSAPAVDLANGGTVYVLGTGLLRAYNLNGTTRWTLDAGATGNNYNQGPVIDEGYVYFKAGGNLQKYTWMEGKQWSSPSAGRNTQPAIMGDYVYANSEGGQIRKYNKATGAEVVGGGFPIATSSSAASLAAVNGKIFHMPSTAPVLSGREAPLPSIVALCVLNHRMLPYRLTAAQIPPLTR